MFDKMLKESCPYHRGPVKHTLEECDMLRRYFNKAGPSEEGGKDQGNNKKGGDKEEEFPEVHNCFMIYGGQVANASARHHSPGRYPLVVDPVIGNARLTKVLMDGGSSLNIIYA
jgi:hypothetical protein